MQREPHLTPAEGKALLDAIHALIDEWAEDILRNPVGRLELDFAGKSIKLSLRVHLGTKTAAGPRR